MNKAKEILDKDFLGLEKLQEYLKNNSIQLESDKDLSVVPLTFEQKQELSQFINKVKTDLIADTSIKTEAQLIELWKSKGIDIEKMVKDFQGLERKYWAKLKELGRLIKANGRKDLVESLEKEVNEIRDKQLIINMKKTGLLSSSYELQVSEKMYRYGSYLALRRKKNKKIEQAYKSYEEFIKNVDEEAANEALILVALVNSYDRFN